MDFKKMMEAKKKKEMNPMEKEAKLSAVGGLKQLASDMMGNDMKGLKKVTVAAPDKAGLEKGLDLAKHFAGKSDDETSEAEEGSDAEEAMEDPIQEAFEKFQAEPSMEHIDALMEHLQKKKSELESSDSHLS